MKPVDLNLEHLRINLKDLIYILPVIWFCFELWTDLQALKSGVLEGRVAALNMELSYMEQRKRNETEERIYETKKDLVKMLMKDLEDMNK